MSHEIDLCIKINSLLSTLKLFFIIFFHVDVGNLEKIHNGGGNNNGHCETLCHHIRNHFFVIYCRTV